MNTLNDLFKGLNSLYTIPGELAAIWLSTPLITGEGKTVRLAPEATVYILNNKMEDVTEDNPANYKVIGVYGTLVNQFEVWLTRIPDNEPLIIKI